MVQMQAQQLLALLAPHLLLTPPLMATSSRKIRLLIRSRVRQPLQVLQPQVMWAVMRLMCHRLPQPMDIH